MNYENHMAKCIELAKLGTPPPNPYVGCIILNAAGEEITSGYHTKCGENHAERDALLKINKDEGHTLIVNLEPCSHHGKTPPCTDLIIEKGIKRVVIGMHDPNPLVSGISQLKASGIEVIENVLKDECRELNEIFIKNKTENKAFVAIKTATTLDGKIATSTGSSKWITSEKAREEVKKIRAKYDAIMTTSKTILADNPTMEHKCKIILDRNSRLSGREKIFEQGEIHIFRNEPKEVILQKIYEMGIMSILIEAGGVLNGEMLEYTDKIYHFIAPKITGDNSAKSCFDYHKITNISESKNFKIKKIESFEPDILLTYYPNP